MHEGAAQALDKVRPAAVRSEVTKVLLADTDANFACDGNETLLRAALKAGFAVPYECANGACGSREARLLEGAVVMRWPGATGLSERDRKRGDRILCCQSIPTTDCVIQWASHPGNSEPIPDEILAEVCGIEDLCPGVRRLRVRLEREVFALPGQFMLFDLWSSVGFRAYSMANASEVTDAFEFLIKAKPGGAASEILFERVREGDTLRLDGPYGRG